MATDLFLNDVDFIFKYIKIWNRMQNLKETVLLWLYKNAVTENSDFVY